MKVYTTVQDPVCGMDLDAHESMGGEVKYDGKTYYFCGPECKVKFESNPRKYARLQAKAAAAAGVDARRN